MKRLLHALIAGAMASWLIGVPLLAQTFISGYPSGVALQGPELFLGDQSGVTVTFTANQIKAFTGTGGGGGSITGSQVITALGYTPSNKAGDTFTGEVKTPASAVGTAGFNLGQGSAPTSPVNGDLWITSGGVFARVNGSTTGPFTSSVINLGAVAHQFVNSFTNGTPGTAQPSCADLSNSVASCSTDATQANNISGGTLNNARLSAQVPLINVANNFTAAQANPHSTLTFGATVTPDFTANGQQWKITLTGNVTTFAFPLHSTDGICGTLKVVQDGTGSRTIGAYGAGWKWPGGTPPVLSTGANAQDIISFCTDGTTEIDGAIQKQFQ